MTTTVGRFVHGTKSLIQEELDKLFGRKHESATIDQQVSQKFSFSNYSTQNRENTNNIVGVRSKYSIVNANTRTVGCDWQGNTVGWCPPEPAVREPAALLKVTIITGT